MEFVCGDGLCELGDTTEVEGGISSIMGDLVCD